MTTGEGGPAGAITIGEALAWIAEMFEEPQANVQQDTSRDAIAGWDSLGQLVLMSALDERFGIRLDVDPASLQSVEAILAILRQNGRLVTD